MHVAVFVHISDPFVCLTLRVDDEWPSSTVENENAVISAQGVSGEAVLLPISDLHLAGEDPREFVVVRDGDIDLFAFVDPRSHHFSSVLGVEGSYVGYSSWGKNDVTDQVLEILL